VRCGASSIWEHEKKYIRKAAFEKKIKQNGKAQYSYVKRYTKENSKWEMLSK
jgi:hypothetical protein